MKKGQMPDIKSLVAIAGAIGTLILLLAILPALTNPTPENTEKALSMTLDFSIPWWVKAIQWAVTVPVIGTIIILAIVLIVAYNYRSD